MVTRDNQRFIPHYSISPTLYAAFRQGYTEADDIILSDKKLKNKFNIEGFMQEYEEYEDPPKPISVHKYSLGTHKVAD
ncbi:hypothetical protein VN97_g8332 [Penicillium thymicola]|uniref:Uncharacterized protein n=1 Tax=Penicillium thymicola TaxID=293382 RepID=A0AAI9TD37_PENTH|nr:hypothetical protein VN97_g8332 [Penicillium thymicola]